MSGSVHMSKVRTVDEPKLSIFGSSISLYVTERTEQRLASVCSAWTLCWI